MSLYDDSDEVDPLDQMLVQRLPGPDQELGGKLVRPRVVSDSMVVRDEHLPMGQVRLAVMSPSLSEGLILSGVTEADLASQTFCYVGTKPTDSFSRAFRRLDGVGTFFISERRVELKKLNLPEDCRLVLLFGRFGDKRSDSGAQELQELARNSEIPIDRLSTRSMDINNFIEDLNGFGPSIVRGFVGHFEAVCFYSAYILQRDGLTPKSGAAPLMPSPSESGSLRSEVANRSGGDGGRSIQTTPGVTVGGGAWSDAQERLLQERTDQFIRDRENLVRQREADLRNRAAIAEAARQRAGSRSPGDGNSMNESTFRDAWERLAGSLGADLGADPRRLAAERIMGEQSLSRAASSSVRLGDPYIVISRNERDTDDAVIDLFLDRTRVGSIPLRALLSTRIGSVTPIGQVSSMSSSLGVGTVVTVDMSVIALSSVGTPVRLSFQVESTQDLFQECSRARENQTRDDRAFEVLERLVTREISTTDGVSLDSIDWGAAGQIDSETISETTDGSR